MGKVFSRVLAASAGLLLAASAMAAEGDAQLRVDQGKVMVSQGGDFTPVSGSSPVRSGDRIMVTEGAVATVLYDQGCQRQYTVPGVYPYEEGCPKAAAAQPGDKMVNWTMVSAIGVSAVLVGAAAGSGGSDDKPPPVSR